LQQLLQTNKNDSQAINYMSKYTTNNLNNNNIYNLSNNIHVDNWVSGIKLGIGKRINIQKQSETKGLSTYPIILL
jgi:hypothetical protein